MINAVLAGIRTRQAELQAEALHPGDHDAESYFTRNQGPADRFMGSGPKGAAKRGHEGIEPSTSPTLKENHTTRPMAHARVDLGIASRYTGPASPVDVMGTPSQEHCLQSSVGRAVGC